MGLHPIKNAPQVDGPTIEHEYSCCAMVKQEHRLKARRKFRRKETGSFGFLFSALMGWAKLCHPSGVIDPNG